MVEKLIQKIKPKYYVILAFFLGALAMFLMLTYSQMLTTGKYVILNGDAWEIYISNIRMLLRNLSNGETIWYSFTTSMGYNTALTVAFELMSPLNILFLLFPDADPNVILAIIIVIKVGLAASAFQLFSANVLGNKGALSVVFSVFYAMSAFTIVYCLCNFMWLDGVYMLPIVAWATYYAVRTNKYKFLALSFTYIFIVQFYMGYLIGGFSLLYYILLIVTQDKNERVAKIGVSIGKFVLASVTAIALSAFLWVPVICFLINHTVSDRTAFSELTVSLPEIINNLFWGEYQDLTSYPYIYCGIPSLMLFPFFFFNRKLSIRERLLYGILLVFFVLGCLIKPIYVLLHSFDAPDMWNYRFSFIISFLICAMSCKQSMSISDIRRKHIIAFCIGLVLLYCFEQRIQPLLIGNYAKNSNIGLLINVSFVILWIILGWVFLRTKEKRITTIFAIVLLMMVETVTNACVRTYDHIWKEGLVKEDYYYAWEKDTQKNLDEIERMNKDMKAESFYRICIWNDAIHNSDAYFGYNGITDFNSAEQEALRDFMKNMGVDTSPRCTSGTGLTPTLQSILSVKNTARLYLGFSSLGIETDARVHDNPYWLPIGYMVNEGVKQDFEFSSDVFNNQNQIIYAMSGVNDVFWKIPDEYIVRDENGLSYLDEEKMFYMSGSSGGQISFVVKGIDDQTFLQIVPCESEDIPSDFSWDVLLNQANLLDGKVSSPFAVEMIQAGDNHKITIDAHNNFSGMYRIEDINIYALSQERYEKMYEELSRETLETEEVKNGYLRGRINTSGNRGILFTSIPYTDGWTVTVNGREEKIVPIMNGAFCGLEIPDAGEYEIEFTYHCPGAKLGLWVSFGGIALLALLLLLERRKKLQIQV